MIKLSAVCFLLFVFSSAKAQISVSGTVVNNLDLEPVPNVIVTVLKDGKIINHTKTDSKGKFTVSNVSKGLEITFRKTEYKTLKDIIKDESGFYYLIPTQERPEFLEEVVLNVKKSYIRSKNDTTTFSANSLRTKNVTTVEDLIKNIPGVSVDALTGTIKYQNTEIETVLVDGVNIVDKNYQIISKSLTEKSAKAIQLIEGHTENKTLKNFTRDDKIALNLLIDDTYKNRITGSIKAGYGIKDRYDNSLNAFSFSRSINTVNLIAHNNIGHFSLGSVISNRDIEPNNRLLVNQNLLESVHLRGYVDNSSGLSLFNTQNILQNNDFTVSSNQTFEISDGSDAKINAVLYRDTYSYTQSLLFSSIENDFLNIYSQQNTAQKFNNLDVKLQFNKRFNPNEELQIRGIVKNRSKNISELGLQNSRDFNLYGNLKKPEVQLSADYSLRINPKSALIIYNNTLLSSLEEKDYFFSDDAIHHHNSEIINPNEATQKINYNSFKNNLGINYAYRFSANNILTSGLLYSNYMINTSNNVFLRNQWENQTLSETFNQNINYISPQLQWAYFRKKSRLTAQAQLNYFNNKITTVSDRATEITSSIQYNYKTLTQKFNSAELTFGFHRNMETTDFVNRNDMPLRKNSNEFYISNIPNLYYISNTFSGLGSYNLQKQKIKSTVSTTYSFGEKPVMDKLSSYEDYYVREIIPEENAFKNTAVSLDLEKFFASLSTNVKWSTQFTSAKWETILEDNLYENNLKRISLRVTAGSAFSSFFNYAVGILYNHSYFNQQPEAGQSTKTDIKTTLAYLNFNLNFFENRLVVNLENEYINYDNTNNFNYSSIMARYKPEKSNFDFGIDFKNIFNNKSYFVRRQSLNYMYESERTILPQMIVFNFTYYLNN